jgi:hypothetical protein
MMPRSPAREALNEPARKGSLGEKRQRAGRFAQKSFSLGAAQDLRWDKALDMGEAMEDEELSRKLAPGK